MTLVLNSHPPTLESVLMLAGASDSDREAWKAQRRLGITGTEIRDLHLGHKRSSDLIAEKLGRRSNDFAGNAYTAWGNAREPVIADLVQQRFGIIPESHLFRAPFNERFLVSPDGLGAGFGGELLGCEIKTAGVPIPLGSDAFKKKGYLIQIVWNMVVTGARSWLYAWELRLDGEQGFEAGELTFEWVHWNDEIETLAAQLVVEAEQFLRDLDAAAAEAYVEPEVDDVIDTHAVNYLRFIAEETEAGAAKKAEYDAILGLVGEREDFRQEGATARVTLTPMKIGTRVENDADAAKAARADLWEAFESARAAWDAHQAQYQVLSPTEAKPRLTITAIKKEKKA